MSKKRTKQGYFRHVQNRHRRQWQSVSKENVGQVNVVNKECKTMNFLKMFSPVTIFQDLCAIPAITKLWLVLFAVGIGYLSHTWGDPWYGTLSAVSGVICVVLVAEGRISNYAWGLINCVLYGLVSYQNKFYGDMSLNWFMYVPFQFIGFYIWHKSMNLSDDGELEVKVLSPRELLIGALLVCWMTFVLGTALNHFGGAHPFTDASNVVWSVAATWLMAKRYREQWFCWICVNITGIAMWSMATIANEGPGLSSLAMWLAFFVNSLYGVYKWSVKYHQAKLLREAKAW